MRPLTIVVCVKVSPDTAQLRADPQTGAPRLVEAPPRISTFDENALEEAVRLRERHGGKVVALSLVAEDPPPELVLRLLAMGADEAVLVEESTVAQADSLATASILAAAMAKIGGWDLVFCGEGSIDAYSCQVGPRLAESLGLPALTHVTRVEVRGDGLRVQRALEDRTLTVEAPLPVLLTVGQEINEARFPTVLQIMGASKKPTLRWSLSDLGFEEGRTAAAMSGLRTVEVYAPQIERRGLPIRGETTDEIAMELARKLFELGLLKVE
ncbi:MAG: electron transfer flavoprotein subunit beta/FixA family protein [Planctomycetota bacterium]